MILSYFNCDWYISIVTSYLQSITQNKECQLNKRWSMLPVVNNCNGKFANKSVITCDLAAAMLWAMGFLKEQDKVFLKEQGKQYMITEPYIGQQAKLGATGHLLAKATDISKQKDNGTKQQNLSNSKMMNWNRETKYRKEIAKCISSFPRFVVLFHVFSVSFGNVHARICTRPTSTRVHFITYTTKLLWLARPDLGGRCILCNLGITSQLFWNFQHPPQEFFHLP